MESDTAQLDRIKRRLFGKNWKKMEWSPITECWIKVKPGPVRITFGEWLTALENVLRIYVPRSILRTAKRRLSKAREASEVITFSSFKEFTGSIVYMRLCIIEKYETGENVKYPNPHNVPVVSEKTTAAWYH